MGLPTIRSTRLQQRAPLLLASQWSLVLVPMRLGSGNAGCRGVHPWLVGKSASPSGAESQGVRVPGGCPDGDRPQVRTGKPWPPGSLELLARVPEHESVPGCTEEDADRGR